MKEKLFMYPGYDDNHNLKAVELDNTIIFGNTGKGKTTVLRNMLEDIKVHNPERECESLIIDASKLIPSAFIETLQGIIKTVGDRLSFLRDERFSKSIPMLVREGIDIPYNEMIIGIDNCYFGNAETSNEVIKLLNHILVYSKVAGITVIVTTQTIDNVSVELLNNFNYRICLPCTPETANRVMRPNAYKEFDTLERVLLFREKCAIIHPYFVLGMTGERISDDYEDFAK